MNPGRELLPTELRGEVVDLRPLGVDEWGIRLRFAKDACRLLAASGLAILGGDYWLSGDDGYQPASEAWAIPRRAGESWQEYVESSLVQAEAAIDARAEHMSGLPACVVIVSSSEERYNQLVGAELRQRE